MASISAPGSLTPLVLGPPPRPKPARATPLERYPDADPRMADAVRGLALDAVESAGSGDAGPAVRMAGVATVLWSRVLRFDATDPRWPDRDRLILSSGPASVLLYALLHLTGHAGMDADALRRHRQLDSPAAGHPEHGGHPAIEATTGPPGQGVADRRRHGAGGADDGRPVRAQPGRPPHLGHRLRRRPDARHQPGSGRPRRSSPAGAADGAVGRRQRSGRGRRRVRLGRHRAALRGERLDDAPGRRRRRPGQLRRRSRWRCAPANRP